MRRGLRADRLGPGADGARGPGRLPGRPPPPDGAGARLDGQARFCRLADIAGNKSPVLARFFPWSLGREAPVTEERALRGTLMAGGFAALLGAPATADASCKGRKTTGTAIG